jgi:hypothetical protein
MNGKYQANKQRKFGADYLITGNALTKKDNEILQKYAGVTLCTTNQLSKQSSRTKFSPMQSPAMQRVQSDVENLYLLQLEEQPDKNFIETFFNSRIN